MLQRSVWILTALALILSSAWAGGGISLFIGKAEASPDPLASGGLLLVQMQGCGKPQEAKVRATAKTAVNGETRVVPLEVVRLLKPETVVLKGDQVKQGNWTVTVTAEYFGHEWTRIVPMKDGAFDRSTIVAEHRSAK